MLKCKILPKDQGLELVGTLDASTVAQLSKLLSNFKSGAIKLDMTGLTELCEEALRPILLATKRLRKSGGDLQIVGANPQIRNLLIREGYHNILTLL